MAREINRLSARAVASIKKDEHAKPWRHPDGAGLYLQISAFNTKAWIYRFTLNGKPRQMGLGSLDTVTLAEAREEALQARKLVRVGIDPINRRRAEKAARRLEGANSKTFRQCAEDYIRAHGEEWKNTKHASQWPSTLEKYAYPVIGDLPVQAVDTAMVLRVLEPIWKTKTETATRVRGRIEAILNSATVLKYRSGDNPAVWRGRLDQVLAKPSRIRDVRHHPALPYDEIGAFMSELRVGGATAARGLEYLILTAARTGEVTDARWDEIKVAEKVWTIPASRMKSKRPHRVPLSADALAVIEAMGEVRQSDFIFPGYRANRPLSNMAFSKVLRRMGRAGVATAHGFRSTFRDWAAERTAYPNEVAEMALAHAIADKTEDAYRRGDLLPKRRPMMDDWAAFCRRLPVEEGETVVLLDERR